MSGDRIKLLFGQRLPQMKLLRYSVEAMCVLVHSHVCFSPLPWRAILTLKLGLNVYLQC